MLSPQQREQIAKQIQAYERSTEAKSVKIPFGDRGLELTIEPLVADPEIMNSGIQIMEYLQNNPELVEGKVVTDMGTGSGIIGITAGLLKAKLVQMADIDEQAINNAKKNVGNLNLNNCEVFQSDLFENFSSKPKADTQIFNHPFFSEEPIKGKEWTRMMMGGTELLGRYLQQAPQYSNPDARYILPWLTLAENRSGQLDNDPGKRAQDYGYRVIKVTEQPPVEQGIQRSLFKIYELAK